TVSGSAALGDRLIPPVVLRNPSPVELAVSMSVTFDQPIGSTQPMVEVGLGFASGEDAVQFAGNERVACDGADLPPKAKVAVFVVLRAPAAQAAGRTVHCEDAAGGVVAGIVLQLPTAPAITSPQIYAHVARSVETPIAYHDDSAIGSLPTIVALGPP